jgi:hypothetical protein
MKRAVFGLVWVLIMGSGGNANAAFFGLFGGDEAVPSEPGDLVEKCDPKSGFMGMYDSSGVLVSILNTPCVSKRPWFCSDKNKDPPEVYQSGHCTDDNPNPNNNCGALKNKCEGTGLTFSS